MIVSFFLGFLGVKIPQWLSGPLKWLTDAAIIALLLYGVYSWIEHKGEKKGAAKVTATVEKAHAKTVAEAKADTAKAQETSDAIGKRVAATNEKTTSLVTEKTTEIHNAIANSPPVTPDNPVPAVFDTSSVRASINALVDRSNGAAKAADAER